LNFFDITNIRFTQFKIEISNNNLGGKYMGVSEDPFSNEKKPLENWNDEMWDTADGDSEIADTELWDDDTNTEYSDED
jgi:hypothetical protein